MFTHRFTAIRAAETVLAIHGLDLATGHCRKCRTPGWCQIHADTAAWLQTLSAYTSTTTANTDDGGVSYARFLLVRRTDVSGVSGTGVIADGAVWDDGHTVLYWRGTTTGVRQLEAFRHWTEIDKTHGHHGTTLLTWLDEPPLT